MIEREEKQITVQTNHDQAPEFNAPAGSQSAIQLTYVARRCPNGGGECNCSRKAACSTA